MVDLHGWLGCFITNSIGIKNAKSALIPGLLFPTCLSALQQMGLQTRNNTSLVRLRITRFVRQLFPNFVAREDRFAPLALLSISYVLGIVGSGVYLVCFALLPYFSLHPFRNGVLLTAFSWCITMCVISYLLTAFADPGRVPDSWRPQIDVPATITTGENLATSQAQPPHPPAVDVVTMLTSEGQPRYCTKCRIFKPDRTHHCSSCGRCVLLMDHHCPFTGNSCIGFSNRKFFVLFLYYAAAGCAMVSVTSPYALLHEIDTLGRDGQDVDAWDVFWIIGVLIGKFGAYCSYFLYTNGLRDEGYMLCFVHALALGGFAGFHTYLVLRNRTTIESNEPRQALHGEALKRMDSTPMKHWCAIMGHNPLLWFIPVSLSREGDGVHWRRMDEVL